jgi:hypothetical protein
MSRSASLAGCDLLRPAKQWPSELARPGENADSLVSAERNSCEFNGFHAVLRYFRASRQLTIPFSMACAHFGKLPDGLGGLFRKK